jgi:hypothetical protein
MIRYILVLILLGNPLFSVVASAAAFRGTVYEKGFKLPLKEASVILLPQKIRAITDDSGAFTLDIPESAAEVVGQRLIIQKSGYEKYESDFSASTDGSPLYLNRITSLEYETTIVSQEKKDPSLRKIKAKEAVMIPGAAADAIKALQNLPGVNRTPGFSSQIIVQGSAPEETVYSIDQHEVPIMFHFGGLSSVLMPELLGDIDFYTAGYQAPYGRALGGVINANTVSEVPQSDSSKVAQSPASNRAPWSQTAPAACPAGRG